ncbi:GDP-6-deoxy-D-mannose reductase [Klugiella xanthotipulae]|uniref:GDP-4-dehydro-6-deoxy-D-mannose reductase n=1 Tax=Klugiella xanthotipulae TaxID=244735 RepID=A0A543I6S6_9MICO|nr:NAD-dependent epimerase/dehydratase family protein [Klugiella xanthotipulae]TQM66278.1 GDP-4-dehydro-6-deoxy-D-mannose reductase [Klugiella xanthotipulae]
MTVNRVTVTGVDGFVGRHVARLAADAGLEVIGVSRSPQLDPELSGVVHRYLSADLTEEWPADALGDAVIHLAGLAAVGPSFDAPQEYLSANSAMVTHLGEAILREGRAGQTRILAVSSGSVYGQGLGETPIDESAPVQFTSPYVVSKVLVENQLAYYGRRGIATAIARPFNHIGPGQRPGFLVPDLQRALAAHRPGEPLAVGNLDTRRDYSDVRDVADAYLRLVTSPEPVTGVFNVCSGRARSGWEILDALCESMGRPRPEVVADPSRFRPTDPQVIVGSADRLRAETGWAPERDAGQSIRDFVDSL